MKRISIVTPCLNQADSIEAALRSVLDQAGPRERTSDWLEYIVMDGGSADGTREIIERYADRLAYWVSEPDRGQSHALNKGFARATGDVLGWLNADDLLTPGALARVREAFARGDCDVLCGACLYRSPDGVERVQKVTLQELALLDVYDSVHQPSCFWRRDWHEKVGGINERLQYGMDWDLWLRLAKAGARFAVTDAVLSVYRMTGCNKTVTGGERRNRELYELLVEHHGKGPPRLLTELAYRVLWPLKRIRGQTPAWLYRTLSDTARTTALIALGPLMGFDRVRCCTHPFS